MLDELKKHLSDYEIKTLTTTNCENIMDIIVTNQSYFILTDDAPADINNCKEMAVALPPNLSLKDKYFIGFWKNSQAVAALDFYTGFPNKSCIWIGLLLVHGNLHGKSIGSQIVKAILNASQFLGYEAVQLGVVDNNLNALSFWEKLGFGKVRESKVKREGKPDWNIIVMEKRIV